jgi:hypothetical protein
MHVKELDKHRASQSQPDLASLGKQEFCYLRCSRSVSKERMPDHQPSPRVIAIEHPSLPVNDDVGSSFDEPF